MSNELLKKLEIEERYRLLLSRVPIVLFALDKDGIFTLSEGKGLATLGFQPGQVVGQSIFKICRHEPVILDNVLRTLAGEEVKDSVEIHSGPGTGRIFETQYTPIKDERNTVTGLIGIALEITDHKLTERELRHLAYHDVLTKLPNRMLFEDRMGIALARSRRNKEMLALLLFDLDDFKGINDTLGHRIGDRVLRTLARRLTEHLRAEDTLARLAGDEFILLLPEIKRVENVVAVLKRIFDAFKDTFHYRSRELRISISIGVALYPHDGEDAETLFKNADEALYRAKEKGGNGYQFYSTPTFA